MALLDKVSDDLDLFIGGLFTLRRKEALQSSRVTHVLSVLRLPLDQQLFQGFVHKVVELDDVDDENFLEHFPGVVHFIHDGLTSGGGVLVHCAMGKSRSATAVCAYLIANLNLTPPQALALLRQARPICEPNDGFMAQLELWHTWGCPTHIHTTPAYERWLYHRQVELSRACGQAPDRIRFEDEHPSSSAPSHSSNAASRPPGGRDFELRCRKCRRQLATSRYLLPHHHPVSAPSSPRKPAPRKPSPRPAPTPTPTTKDVGNECSHFFLDPLSWMREELEQGHLDGRLECPKCHTNVGKYAWQGMKCSCGEWVLPGISLAKGKVDQVAAGGAVGGGGGGGGIRMPPGMSHVNHNVVRKAGQENL